MLYIGCLIIVNGQNIRKKFEICPLLSCESGKLQFPPSQCSLCTHQVPLNRLQTAILRLLGGGGGGGHGSGYTGLAASMWVAMDAQVPALSPNDHPNQSQG